MDASIPDRIAIGYIARTKGIRGDVKVEVLSHDPQRFVGLDALVLQKDGHADRVVHIENWSPEAPGLRMKFFDIDTPEAAKETLVKGYLTVTREQVAELPVDTYYIFELLGCTVEDIQGRRLGEITDVLELPSADTYVVRDGDHEFMIPAVREFIIQVNIPQRRLVVQGIDELLA
jgi:16S rRNA processing protein RimM